MIDTEGFYGAKNITVALPPSLRVCGSVSAEGVYGYAKHEHISLVTSKDFFRAQSASPCW